jgi:glycerophosphoryl diester phosphodiesterase
LIHEFDLASNTYTGVRYKYPLDPRGTNIGDFVMFNSSKGLVIERDGTQGDPGGFKTIYKIELGPENASVSKELAEAARGAGRLYGIRGSRI